VIAEDVRVKVLELQYTSTVGRRLTGETNPRLAYYQLVTPVFYSITLTNAFGLHSEQVLPSLNLPVHLSVHCVTVALNKPSSSLLLLLSPSGT
jgi:hypothetical protein